ncbi:MAG: P1 family peptidase [Tissierellia bacterium]|nr:P1 family peptidase [Tissierellia bacterium]
MRGDFLKLYDGYLNDVEGIRVGHAENFEAMTGVTVIIAEDGATGGVDVRGSAPGTRETDLFQAEKTVDKVHSIVLAGGSAYGLEAATGVMEYLEHKGIGFKVGNIVVPIVAGAVIFDLANGRSDIRPDSRMGLVAAINSENHTCNQGKVGAGVGATCGKVLGMDKSSQSGLGSASLKVGDLVVSAMVVVNAMGDVYDFDGNIIAGVKGDNGFLSTVDIIKKGPAKVENGNTTIGLIATNAILNKGQANKIAQLGQNGLARRISPVHTVYDGDTIFTMATNKVEADLSLVGVLAVEAMEKAIVNSILSTEEYYKTPQQLYNFDKLEEEWNKIIKKIRGKRL